MRAINKTYTSKNKKYQVVGFTVPGISAGVFELKGSTQYAGMFPEGLQPLPFSDIPSLEDLKDLTDVLLEAYNEFNQNYQESLRET